jgi:hypothetical protein
LVASLQLPHSLYVLGSSTRLRVRLAQTTVLNVPLLIIGYLLPVLQFASAWLAQLIAGRDGTHLHPLPADAWAAALIAALGVIPWLVAATIASSLWAGHIVADASAFVLARRAAAAAHGGPAAASQTAVPPAAAPLQSLTEALYRSVLVLAMTLGAVLLDVALPAALGRPAAFFLTAILASAVAHDPLWSLEGVPVLHRFTALERHWPYYFGFGLTAAALTFFASAVANAAAYNLVLPWLYLAALLHPPRTGLKPPVCGPLTGRCCRRSHPQPVDAPPALPLDSYDVGFHYTRPFAAASLRVFDTIGWMLRPPAAAAAPADRLRGKQVPVE